MYDVAQRRWLDQQDSGEISCAKQFGFQIDPSGVLQRAAVLTSSATSRKRSKDFFHRRREAMPPLLAPYDLIVRHPVELNHATLARKWLVAMPRVVAPLECKESSRYRRQFEHCVIKIILRSQQPQLSTGAFPFRVQIKQHRD